MSIIEILRSILILPIVIGLCTLAWLGAVAGGTILATKGYGSDKCSSCKDHVVYVPLRKLRDMNRGQAAGAWFAGQWFHPVARLETYFVVVLGLSLGIGVLLAD